MSALRFSKLADNPPQTGGYSLATRSVADDGSLLFLSVEASGAQSVRETDSTGGATFPRPSMPDAKRFRLTIKRAGHEVETIDLPKLDIALPSVDVFPNGKILVCGCRCAWRGPGDFDLNGAVIDPSTGKVTRFLLGDGIARTQIDALGRIWVGYFDEGVFGNYGWGGPGPAPIGAAGLVCFSEFGDKLWELPGNKIADCYAINVSGAQVAAYYYDDFPLCTISPNFRTHFRKTALRGCGAFAISETSVLFSGQYDDPPGRAYLGRLGRHEVSGLFPTELQKRDGTPIAEGQLLGRGRYLYLFDADNVWQADLDQTLDLDPF